MTPEKTIANKVAEIYTHLDSQIKNLNSDCAACGNCCNFAAYDHKLFVTTPELIYLKETITEETIKKMTTGTCPYNVSGKCSIHPHRFAGCRIFHCKAAPDVQSQLSEQTLTKLKSLCSEFEIPYHYTDLATALNN